MQVITLFFLSFVSLGAFSSTQIDIVKKRIERPEEIQTSTSYQEEGNESPATAFGYLDNLSDLTFDPNNIYSRKFGLYLRGSLPGQLKYEIDGENQVDPTSMHHEGRFDLFIPLPFTQIKINKGPQTVLSSGGASAGVISLQTNDKINYISFGVGSFQHTRFSSQLMAFNKLSARFAFEKREGPSVYPSSDDQRAEDDRVSKINTQIKYQFNKNASVTIQANRLKGSFDQFNKDDPLPEEDYRQNKIIFRTKKLFPSLKTKVEGSLSGTEISRRYVLSENSSTSYDVLMASGDLKANTVLENNSYLNWGMSSNYSSFGGSSEITSDQKQNIWNLDLYGIYTNNSTKNLSWNVGPRLLFGNSGDNQIVAQVGIRYLNHFIKLSRGTRRPSFYELYSMFGSPDLKNENTLGLEYVYKSGRFKFEGFLRQTNQFISWNFKKNSYGNIDSVNTVGSTLSFSKEGSKWDSETSLTLLYQREGESRKRIAGLNDVTVAQRFVRQMGKNLNLSVNFKGLFFRYGLNEEKLKYRWFANLSALVKIDQGESLSIRAENLFQEKSTSLYPVEESGVNLIATYTRSW